MDLTDHWVTAAGLRVHAVVSPPVPERGPDVVLLHGMVVAGRSMRFVAERLAAAGCRAWAPDLPGFGLSEKTTHALDVDTAADVLAEWMVAAGLDRADVLGNSFGCQIAAAIADRHPGRVRRLLLLAPTIDPRQRRRALQVLPWLRRPTKPAPVSPAPAALAVPQHLLLKATTRWLGQTPSLRRLIVSEYLSASLLRSLSTLRHCLRDAIEERLPRIAAPTAVLRGADDGIVHQDWAEQATGLLPHGRLVVVPGGTHDAEYDAPDAVAAAVIRLLTGPLSLPEAA